MSRKEQDEQKGINWKNSETVVIGVNIYENRTYVAGSGNSWHDLALVLEGLGVVMQQAAKQQGWTMEEMAIYVHEYLEKVENDYDKTYRL